jgi:hypothetical protein
MNNRLFHAIPALLQEVYDDEVRQSALSTDEKERCLDRIMIAPGNHVFHVDYKFGEQKKNPITAKSKNTPP